LCLLVVIIGLSQGANATNTDSIRALLPALQGTRLINALNTLAWELKYSKNQDAWNFSQRAGKLLKMNPDRKEQMYYYRNLSALYVLRADLDSSLLNGEKGLQLARELDEAFQQGKILNLLAIGYREKGIYPQAVAKQKEAIALFEQLGDTAEVLGNLNNLAISYGRMNNDTAELTIHQRVFSMEEKRGNATATARSANNVGMALISLRRTDEARVYFQTGLRLSEAADNQQFMASACFGFGECERLDSNYNAAVQWYNKAVDICEKNGFNDFLSKNMSILGEVYERLDLPELALSYYEKAINILEDRSGNLVNAAAVAVKLAGLLLEMEQTDKASSLVNDYLAKADSVDFGFNLPLLLKLSASIDFQRGSYKSAYEKLTRATVISDSLVEMKLIVETENIHARYEMARMEESNARLVQHLEQQNKINKIQWGIIALTTVLVLLSAMFLILLRRKSKHLKVANKLLSEQKMEIEQKAAELDQLNKTKDKFFSIVAHDLKSPLTGIVGFSTMLSTDFESFSDQEKKNMIQHMKESTHQVSWLLDNLLHWARSQMKMTMLKPKRTRLKSFVKSETELLSHVASLKKIELKVDMTDELEVMVDQEMLRFVIRNLVSNALKFTHQGGRVTVEAHRLQGVVNLSVSDSGIGMTHEQMASLFALKAGGTTRGTNDEQGTGLGLVLCKDFIEQNGGSIEVRSEPGVGTTFTVSLPAE